MIQYAIGGKQKNQDEFHFVSIEKYFINNNQKKSAFHIISDRCATDLDINETFKIIDRTSSKIGQQYLYYKLRTIEKQDRLLDFIKLTLLFEKNKDLRLKTQLALTNLNSNDSYSFEDLVTSQPINNMVNLHIIYPIIIFHFIRFFISCIFYFSYSNTCHKYDVSL